MRQKLHPDVTTFFLGSKVRYELLKFAGAFGSLEVWNAEPSTHGIFAAHKALSQICPTQAFAVIDEDNYPLYDNDLLQEAKSALPRLVDSSIIFYSRNEIIPALNYGHGGIKIFPTFMFKHVSSIPGHVDMTEHLSTMYAGLRVIPLVLSEHRFATSPYQAFRAAFRETYKISQKYLSSAPSSIEHKELKERMSLWTADVTTIDTEPRRLELSKFVCKGANLGFETAHRDPQFPINVESSLLIAFVDYLKSSNEA